MAHKKGLGSSRNGRDSNAKRLGVKVFAGETVTGGEIIVRQRGTRFKPGIGVGIGKDDTIYAKAAGTVDFREGRRGRVISVCRPMGRPTPAAARSVPARLAAAVWPTSQAFCQTIGARACSRRGGRPCPPCRRAGCAASGRTR